jgi:predicted nucleotidyltransferase component of viral defense system
MNIVATLPASERALLFKETANRRGLAIQIIEKDFWVCWVLTHLFELPEIGQHLIFKGGTSLSKVFGVIERFSEDIDISINRKYLGFAGSDDPQQIEGSNKRKKKLDELESACIEIIKVELLPSLNKSFEQSFGEADKKQGNISWQLTPDSTDPQALLFEYPRDRSDQSVGELAYIRPVIRIEMGARSDHWPSEKYAITPYAAEEFPDYFETPTYKLKVLEAERTFWEKATILHSEHNRPEEYITAGRMARHYYDVYKLAQTPILNKALDNLDLLNSVVEHKKTFFKRAGANYDDACNGNIRLVPEEAKLRTLKVDYEGMKDMFFGAAPLFDEIIASLEGLQKVINTKVSSRVANKEVV